MPLEFWENAGQLVWVRNPFTGTVTYFTDIHRKPDGYREQGLGRRGTLVSSAAPAERRLSPADLDEARACCAFCPGNEQMTMEEVLRVAARESAAPAVPASPWLIRAFYNIVPRIPECCTNGRNESYVVVEDPRHFADGTKHPGQILCSADLPTSQFQTVLRTAVTVARRSYDNPAVKAVLIRKNQGPESGASQPHIHTQVIGSHEVFPPVRAERDVLRREPGILQEILDFVESRGFLIAQERGCFLYFCPFGVFPRSYEVVCPDLRGPITELSAGDLDAFASMLHRALGLLDSLPLDYEIHDGPDLPLHAHVSSRHFPYSNIGGTLNLPAIILAALAGSVRR